MAPSPLRWLLPAVVLLACGPGLPAQPPAAPQILRFVDGVDDSVKPMPPEDVTAQLNDPWAVLVLRKGTFPTGLKEALAALDPAAGAPGLPVQDSYFVSETGQIPVNVAVNREFRMVITRSKQADPLPAVLFSAPAGSREGFIELMGWDPVKKAFNFYRRPEGAKWVWKGDTRDAFRTATRRRGC